MKNNNHTTIQFIMLSPSIQISVCCCTYNRPHLLGELIHSFEIQTYPANQRELIILDDAGQYGDVRGNSWQIISFPRRFASLGEKRNACVSLTSPESKWIVIADDDDIYLPHWLESHVTNFESGVVWSFASEVWLAVENIISGSWHYQRNTYLMHPGHAYEKQLFWEVGGYPRLAGWEDFFFFQSLLKKKIEPRSALENHRESFLIYRRFKKERHMTGMMLDRYQTEFTHELPKVTLNIGWKKDYLTEITQYQKSKSINEQK
jgi:glycosyltransferase involved in cell wall biosynthesis